MKHITVTSETANIKVASSEIITEILKHKHDSSTDVMFDIKLCIEEAVRNAMVHGNKGKAHLPVDISFDIKDNKVTITIEDKGHGFDLSKLPDPTHEENLYKESGRGVYLIHRLMDKVVYHGNGNKVTMEKKLIV